tara:strand:+ start:28 stop:615 length:588 start_codon:yes stop_codon:yes gene_type:complete
MSSARSLTLSVLDIEGGSDAEATTIGALAAGKPLVLDLWHTKCVKCPDALTKLDMVAGNGKHADVTFAACALSLCDKPDGPADEATSQESVTELIDDMWDNLKHCYMTAEQKAAAKAEFGFSAVPFCIVFGVDGAVLYQGDPSKIDFGTIFNPAPAVDAVAKGIEKVELKPLGDANREAAAPAPVLGFGNDDEDF